ncbi:hypothetical protein CN514_20380 [Bacillus sp. AFS001701]|uniref:hypothetical protein n=1 Tax=Bacillaceae TaxID=186817 RepID=UPI000BFA2EC6|nr:hypothetical protein [Bacillus sp. AFS001701]PET46840.1 hypothetical protein CN514_20380 [Bacillus sp. AFS001701]
MGKARFRDKGEWIGDFNNHILVECPQCKKGTKITWVTDKTKLKLVCQKCGIVSGSNFFSSIGEEESLWLQTHCCGKTLWAYNEEHLDFLENYVSASLRERVPNINKSIASRLPNWIKSARNRDEVLKGINKLRKKLNEI